MRFLFGFVALVVFSSVSWGQWTVAERKAITDTLSLGNLVEADLFWDRRPFTDNWRHPFIDEGIDHPLASSDALMSLSSQLASSSVPNALRLLDGTYPQWNSLVSIFPDTSAASFEPAALRSPIVALVSSIVRADEEIKAALKGLTDAERQQLLASLPAIMGEEFAPSFDFTKSKPISLSAALGLLTKVDHRRIMRASIKLAEDTEGAMRQIEKFNGDVQKPVTQTVLGRKVYLFGRGDDVHREVDGDLVIDLGGDDRYLGRAGSGMAASGVLLDIGAGDDLYQTKDLSLGAGLLGIGIARDEGGNDVYRTGALSLGVGVAGVGVFSDAHGSDLYQSKAMSQAYAAFGIGLMIDAKGDDFYDLPVYGQGMARTQGFAVLVDRSGRDVYRAGGSALNSPLFTDVHYSFAQGIGMGFREDTGGTSGGIGMLLDGGGDDAYLAETYAQAASYWFGLGVLWDRSGHDQYSAYHYAQSSAMHLTAAYLFDLAGDDAYSLKFGAGHAIGHDYGVAVLLDRAGNDVYAARDSNPSTGNANGLGLFVDSAGDDRYAGPPGRGNAARGTGSLGIFIDMNGQDKYREGLGDATAVITDSWGIGFDIESARVVGNATAPTERPQPGTIARPTDTELETIYRKATQWGVGSAQSEVEQSIGQLIGIGLPAVEWMLLNKLGSADRLQIRAFTAVIGAVGSPARNALAAKAATGSLNEKRNALSIAVDGRVSELAPVVPALIAQPELRLQAIRAAGALASRESVVALLPLTLGTDNVAVAAAVSLAQIGDERAVGTAESWLNSPNLPIRKAAFQVLARYPLQGLDVGRRLLGDRVERRARLGIELLGLISSPESLNLVADRLLDPSPGIRIQCLIALNGKCPEERRLTLVALRNDPDANVRAVAQRIDPGR
ncbi:MAG: hypothetical protein JNK63_04685 [Chthonomonas sp.]|nr:hypothetical protein [Chthonomonas sp.]